ncbi:MAG: DciA family protein [Acidiferrobacterales bacterium]|nr:DciA family protein [Acidiferrobacterales bacterium]
MDKPNYKILSSFLEESDVLRKSPDFKNSDIYRTWKSAAGASIYDNTDSLTIEDDVLYVSVNSSTWAHELINQQNSILQTLQENGFRNLTEMSVRIRVQKSPGTPLRKKKKQQSRTITPRMRDLFQRLAAQSKNKEAREVFLRLSKLPKRPDD